MKMVKELLNVRKLIKRRKPTYKRQQTNQFAKFKGDGWRRPRGHQSKMRLGRKGHRGMPEVGYGSPNGVKAFNKDGFKEVLVKNVADLKDINTKEEVVVISSKVGGRKKIILLEEIKKLKLTVSNVKDVDKAIEALKKEPKKEKKKKVEKKTEKAPSKAKADEKKEEADEK